MTSEKSSGFESRLTRRMRPSASSRWNRCTTSTTCVTSRSRPCALAESVPPTVKRSEEHTSELQSRPHLVCRLLLEKKNVIDSKGKGINGIQTGRPDNLK